MADSLTPVSSWGRTPRSLAHVIAVSPGQAVFDVPAPRGVLARGLGRSYGDAGLNSGGVLYDMVHDNGLVGLDETRGTVTVRAGASLGDLLAEVVPRGWFPSVVPGTRHVTVGGAVAADVHGKNHHVEGGFGQQVLHFTLDVPSGDRLRVTPQGTPDLFWATVGGMGLTGVIREVCFRLLPIQTAEMSVDTERAHDLDDLMARMSQRDAQYRYSVAWVDLLDRRGMGRGVLTRGDHASADQRAATRRGRGIASYRPAKAVTLPDVVPTGALNRGVVRSFNEAWFRKAPSAEHGRLQSLDGFFFPLDAMNAWNRLYGRRGLIQYQFVVPEGQEEVLRLVVKRMLHRRCPVFLAVLKRLSPQPGLLSFPVQGWTLAADLPADPGLAGALRDLDETVAAAGGRVYLAKDGRMGAEVFRAMYPRVDEWLSVRERMDPDGVLRSDLARRLGLGG